jgi:glycosyltransferase involved in cell wall biosynthesis
MHALSVVVPTRNRPDHAGPCVASILANPGSFELVLIDQSDADVTELAVRPYLRDPRFRIVRTSTRGASNARNLGVSETSRPLIAFTDDDCRVAADWLQQVAKIFAADPAADILYGRVTTPKHLQGKGFAADFEPHRREYHGEFPAVDVPWGIGANMSVRRSLFERIGGFDVLLGPGAPFNAGEEFDLMIRALASGSKVVNAAEVQVEHVGVREGDDASKLMRGYGVSVGATLAKHVRLRTKDSTGLALDWVIHFGFAGLRNALSGKRPTGLGLVAGMLKGMYLSSKRQIDHERHVYVR